MRYLHSTAIHEIFLAQGVYHYWRDGVPQPNTESWSIHQLPQHAMLIRVDEDARTLDGLSVLTEALLDETYAVQRFTVLSDNDRDDSTPLYRADYTIFPDYVHITQQLESAPKVYNDFPLTLKALISLKQTIYLGFLIRQLLDCPDYKAHTLTLALLPTDTTQMLRMKIINRGQSVLTIGRRGILATCYQLSDDRFCWIDKYDIVLKREYLYDGAKYEVKLSDYAYRKMIAT